MTGTWVDATIAEMRAADDAARARAEATGVQCPMCRAELDLEVLEEIVRKPFGLVPRPIYSSARHHAR